MALTDTQKAQVRTYLGYSDQSRQSAGHVPIEGAMSALSTEAVTQVTAILTTLTTLDTALASVESASRAGIVSVDNGAVVWGSDGMSGSRGLERAARRSVARLAAILGVPVARDIYGASVPTSGACGRG